MPAKKRTSPPDLHLLYEAAVQNVDTELDFAERVYRHYRKTAPTTLREDFCGTAKLACRWAERKKHHEAWGIDFHRPTLDRGIHHHAAALTEEQRNRVHLLCGDVLETKMPSVDITVALNFSFCIFKQREILRRYFGRVAEALKCDGIFVIDIYGGTESMTVKSDEVRLIPGFTTPAGQRVPDFEYIWDQAVCNPLTHETSCHIHFKVPGFKAMRKAFTYNWRLWTVPELREILREAGFSQVEVYLHDFNQDGESDEIFRRRTTYENTQGWLAYLVGIK